MKFIICKKYHKSTDKLPPWFDYELKAIPPFNSKSDCEEYVRRIFGDTYYLKWV